MASRSSSPGGSSRRSRLSSPNADVALALDAGCGPPRRARSPRRSPRRRGGDASRGSAAAWPSTASSWSAPELARRLDRHERRASSAWSPRVPVVAVLPRADIATLSAHRGAQDLAALVRAVSRVSRRAALVAARPRPSLIRPRSRTTRTSPARFAKPSSCVITTTTAPRDASASDHLAERLDALRVEPRRRLVEEQEPRRVHQRTGQGDPLALAARIRPERPLGERPELEARTRRLERRDGRGRPCSRAASSMFSRPVRSA